jgi:integrase
VLEKIEKPLGFSKTVGVPRAAPGGSRGLREDPGGRPRRVPGDRLPSAAEAPETPEVLVEPAELRPAPVATRIEPPIREWLMDLQVLGRSPRTIGWYRQKMDWYLRHGGVQGLEELTAYELKRHVAELLAPNTVHGSFETLKAFANWAFGEGYGVDPAVLRVKAPKLPQVEMETYSEAQLEAIAQAAPEGWARLAILTLLGTGMRVGELCALTLNDIEEDGEATFFKIQRGKGGKFRRVPVSRRLRRELVRYLNRVRPETGVEQLLVRPDGRPVRVETVTELFQRIKRKVGFRVHAHKFRHTFATEYLRQGGEIERLRRILGHTTYVMVMRYVHLDKGDLYQDFDLRSPF